MSNVLAEIVEHKRAEIAAARESLPEASLADRIATAPPTRDFAGALRAAHPMGVIAEVKRASPSAGLIRGDFDPVVIATTYRDHGAACVSVLTDQKYFQGSLDDLRAVRAAVDLPLLRKDFILDRYQLLEARDAGADCVLLIAECLNEHELPALREAARELGLQTLVEIFEPENLERTLAVSPDVLGINNRNLKTLVTDLEHVVRLRDQVPPEVFLVSESGIRTRADIERLQAAEIHGVLVGETLMRNPDIGAALDTLLGKHPAANDTQ